MIIISGTITLGEDAHDEMLRLTDELTTATRAEEGNIDYGFWTNASKPGVWHVYEQWESQEALDAHMGAPHMAEFLGAAAGLGITGTSLTAYQVSSSQKFM